MILYYTDIQVDRYSRFDTKTKSGYGLRLDNIVECSRWIASEIEKRKPRVVVNGGDTYNSIGVVASESLSATGLCMSIINDACKKVGAQHFNILGNHDMGILSNSVTTLDHLDFLSDMIVVKEPSEFSIGEHTFGLIPYSNDKTYTEKALRESSSKNDIAFTHLDFNGFKFNASKKSESELSPTSFRKGFRIINGHYHINQTIGNVFCPGSCIQHKYTEFSKDRGIVWIDDELEFHFIQNTVSPWMVKVKSIKELKELNLPKSSYVYLDYNPEEEDLEELDAEMNTYARVLINRSTSSMKMKAIKNKLEGDSPEEVFGSFLKDFYETDLDKNILLQKGLELIT